MEHKDLNDQIYEALLAVHREGGSPDIVGIPDVGWVNLKTGVADHPELLEAWLEKHFPDGA